MIVGAPLSKLDQMAQICATMRAAAALGREAWVAGASAMEAVARRRPGCRFHVSQNETSFDLTIVSFRP